MLKVTELSPQDWANVSEETLKYSFGYDYPSDKNRINLALIVEKESDGSPLAFSTMIEIDGETAYLQHGGNFPPAIGTPYTLKAYLMMIDYYKNKYKFLTTRILNKNTPMLKLALKAGFIPVGTQTNSYGETFLIMEIVGEK